MAQVGKPREKTGARLPVGPKANDKESIALLEMDVDLPDTSQVKTEVKVEVKKEGEDEFKEIGRVKVPTPPAQVIRNNEIQQFYDWSKCLAEENIKVQVSWYLFRSWPKIERLDNQHYIDCGNYPITEQWLLDEHGSGDYMITVNQSGKPKNAKTLCKAYPKIYNSAYPPKVKLDEVDVHYPGNKIYVDKLVAEGKLTSDLKPMNTAQVGGASNDALIGLIKSLIDKQDRNAMAGMKDPKDSAINTAFEIIAKGNATATQMMLDQMKQDDPDKLLKLVTLIMSMTKPAESKGDDGGMMKLLIETQNKNAELMAKKDEQLMNVMMKMFEKANAPKEESKDDGFDKSLDRFMKLMELTNMSGGGGKKSTLETIMEHGAPVLQSILGVAQNFMALKAAGVPGIQQPGASNDPAVINKEVKANITLAPPPANGGVSNGGSNGVAEAMGDGGAENVKMQEAMIAQGLKQLGPMLVGAIERGTSGDSFAESIDTMYGPVAYNQIVGLGMEKMIEILKSDNNLWAKLSPIETLLRKFIDEFIEYGKPEVDESLTIDSTVEEGKIQ